MARFILLRALLQGLSIASRPVRLWSEGQQMVVMVRPQGGLAEAFQGTGSPSPLGEHTDAILNEAGDGLEEIEGLRGLALRLSHSRARRPRTLAVLDLGEQGLVAHLEDPGCFGAVPVHALEHVLD